MRLKSGILFLNYYRIILWSYFEEFILEVTVNAGAIMFASGWIRLCVPFLIISTHTFFLFFVWTFIDFEKKGKKDTCPVLEQFLCHVAKTGQLMWVDHIDQTEIKLKHHKYSQTSFLIKLCPFEHYTYYFFVIVCSFYVCGTDTFFLI